MISDTARQLALALVSDIVARKRSRGISPDYALATELQAVMAEVLASLVADGTLSRRTASVNKIPAYSISDNNHNP